MNIQLKNIGKKYAKTWIFRHIDFNFEKGKSYALVGNNGSGKSTLLKIIASAITPNEGEIHLNGYTEENVYEKLAYCAPYLELVEEMNIIEAIDFHQKFKPLLPSFSTEKIVQLLGFQKDKLMKDYSSGMKQRVKLALAFFSDVDLILLDEPTSNLDRQGIEWYLSLVKEYQQSRTLIIASNVKEEYSFCDEQLSILQYKS
ncbi:MAG: ABC transporter ATP-binding protein [Chitinophagales bacterium]